MGPRDLLDQNPRDLRRHARLADPARLVLVPERLCGLEEARIDELRERARVHVRALGEERPEGLAEERRHVLEMERARGDGPADVHDACEAVGGRRRGRGQHVRDREAAQAPAAVCQRARAASGGQGVRRTIQAR